MSPRKEECGTGKKAQKARPPSPSVSSETDSTTGYDDARDYGRTFPQNVEDQDQNWRRYFRDAVLVEIRGTNEESRSTIQEAERIPQAHAQGFDQYQAQSFTAIPTPQPAPAPAQPQYITLPPQTQTYIIQQPQQASLAHSFHYDEPIGAPFPARVLPRRVDDAYVYANASPERSRRWPDAFPAPSPNCHCPRVPPTPGGYEHTNARLHAPLNPNRRSTNAAIRRMMGPMNSPELRDVFADIYDTLVRIDAELRAIRRKMNNGGGF